jgi:D-3-phosphoglycerate dehydrogenase
MKTSYPKEKIRFLFLEGVHPTGLRMLKSAGYKDIETFSGAFSESELIRKIKDVHMLGIRSKTRLTDAVLEAGKHLLGVGAFCIGTNQIDLDSCTRRGIAVFNSPFSNTRSVAEMVIAHCINLMRRTTEKNAAAHAGEWQKSSENCFEIRGKTLGIVGYGHIGSQVSVLAETLGMNVVFYDVEPKLSLGNARSVKTLDELLKIADVVTLHVPETAATHQLMNLARMKRMKKGACLINYSRGNVVDLIALRKLLENGSIAGAAIDVFPSEPKTNKDPFSTPLQGIPNVILTPHIGGSTMEAQENIGTDVTSKLIHYLESGTTTGSLSVPALTLPEFHGMHRLLHIHHNRPGVLGDINSRLSRLKVNILGQYLQTNRQIGYVVTDCDPKYSKSALEELRKVKHTIRCRSLH